MTGTALVTLLFTDVVSSTELSGRLGHVGSESLRRAHFADLRDAIAAHHGHEVKSMGDGLMVSFATCADGVECAVAMQQAAERLGRSYSPDFRIRIGIAVGEATSDGGDWYGHPAIEAARLCAAADPSAILVSRSVTDLLAEPDLLPFAAARKVQLKGLVDPVEVVDLEWSPLGGRGPFPAILAEARAAVFVGRDAARNRIADSWSDVASGGRRAVLIAGEPGVGKTCLAAEAAGDLHELGASVFFGRCSEGVEIPYQPWAEIVDALVHTHDVDPIATRTELSPLQAILPRRDGTHSAPTGEFERFALFSAVETLLSEASALGPIVLVVDDLHWATKPTLLLLRHLVRRPDLRILFLLTYRDNEVRRTHPLAATLADLRRIDGIDRVSLLGLSSLEVRTVVESTLPGATDDDIDRLVAVLYSETEGNPFFVHEILRHLIETDRLGPAASRTVLARVEDLGIPEGVREVVGRRLDLLSPVANTVLRCAAVIGREFDLDVVERVASDHGERTGAADPAEQVLDAVDEAVAAHLVVETAGMPGRYAFCHSLVQQTLYDELSPSQRASEHLAVAHALERSGDIDERVLSLARHYAAAGGVAATSAARYALIAGDRLCDRAAFEEAVLFGEQALHSLDLADGAGERQLEIRRLLVDVHLAIAHAARMAVDMPRSHAAALDAAAVARAAGCPIALGRAAVAYAAGAAALGAVDLDVVALCEEALAALPAAERALRSELLASLAAHRAVGGEGTAAAGLAADAVALARESGDVETLWSALLAHHITLYGSPAAQTMLDVAEELTSLPVPPGRRRAGWMTLTVGPSSRSIPKLVLGDRAGFDADVDEVARLVASYSHPLTMVLLAQWRGMQGLLDGDFDSAAAHADELARLAEGQVNWDLAQAAQILWLAHERGELPAIRPFIAVGADTNPTVGAYASALAMADAHGGNHEAAVDRALALTRAGLRRDYTLAGSLYCLSEVAAVCSSQPLAALLADELEPYAGLMSVVGTGTVCMATFDRLRGMIATVLGNFTPADAAFASALEREQSIGAPPLEARTRYWYARMLLARHDPGDVDTARGLLAGGRAIADRLGMAGLRDAISALSAS